MAKHKKGKYHGFWIFVKIQVLLMILVLSAVAYYFLGGYAKQVQELRADAQSKVESADRDTFKANQTSLVYDCDGNLISTVKGEKDVYYLDYDQIPSQFIDAMISTEDKKFYTHHGIDFKAILRAALAMVRNKEVKQGGSTITQQLARTVFLSTEKTWQRKVEEIFIALQLEQIYSKDDLMEFYLNNIYFANGYYGIEAASKGYFNQDVSELDLAQVAYLCAIPNNPTLYDPRVNPDNTISRRNRILKNMWEDGSISDEDYTASCSEDVILAEKVKTKNNYVETYTYYCAIQELMKARGFQFKSVFTSEQERQEYDTDYKQLYDDCQQSLYTAGYRIYTSISLDTQKQLQKSIDQELKSYQEKNKEGILKLQSAAVCIDNQTGRVVAIVGGRSQNLTGYTLNRGYQSYRQPGSAIKPLLVYTPSLERGYTPDTIVNDVKIEDGPSQSYYRGKITLRTAVEQSVNTIAWQLFDELTPMVGMEYLQKLNFSKLDSEDYRLPAALGGFTNGVSPLEMAAGYGTLENDGYYRTPTCIVQITTAQGESILETNQEEIQVYKENAARMMTDMMKGVLTEGTAKGLALTDMDCAGKTGTTNDNKDGWFVGYTHYYTTSVWVGYDTPKKLSTLQGGSYPAEIWHNFMEKLHDGLTSTDFLPYIE